MPSISSLLKRSAGAALALLATADIACAFRSESLLFVPSL